MLLYVRDTCIESLCLWYAQFEHAFLSKADATFRRYLYLKAYRHLRSFLLAMNTLKYHIWCQACGVQMPYRS